MLYLGIDEAGRGPVLGPLVLSAVAFKTEKLPILDYFEIKDSKKLSLKKREYLYDIIIDESEFIFTSILRAPIIDSYVLHSSLNILELEYMVKSINAFRSTNNGLLKDKIKDEPVQDKNFLEDIKLLEDIKVFIDSPEKPENFRNKILNSKNFLSKNYFQKNIKNLIVENKADDKFKIVGAASIIAKVTRDRIMKDLEREFGNLGSGYPADPKTKEYIQSLKNIDIVPSFVRKSWKTYQNTKNILF